MDTLLLALRVVLSLGAVVAVLWLVQRRVTRTTRGRGAADPLKVVARRGLGQKASVVVVDTGGQRFVLGVTEHAVNVLHTSEAPDDGVLPELSREASRLRLVPHAVQAEYPSQTLTDATATDGGPEGQAGADTFARMLDQARGNPDEVRRVLLHGVPAAGAPAEMGSDGRAPMTRRSAHGATPVVPQRFRERNRSSSPLDGSILAPSTWKQAAAVIRKGIIG